MQYRPVPHTLIKDVLKGKSFPINNGGIFWMEFKTIDWEMIFTGIRMYELESIIYEKLINKRTYDK